MPKDASKNIDRYKVRGGQLNEYDFEKEKAAEKKQNFTDKQWQKSAKPEQAGMSQPAGVLQKSALQKSAAQQAGKSAAQKPGKSAAQKAGKSAAQKAGKSASKKAGKSTSKKAGKKK